MRLKLARFVVPQLTLCPLILIRFLQSEKRASSSTGQEVWALLDESWAKLEPILLESLIVLDGTIMALKMRECAKSLRVGLLHKKSVEQAFISYNVRASPCFLFNSMLHLKHLILESGIECAN